MSKTKMKRIGAFLLKVIIAILLPVISLTTLSCSKSMPPEREQTSKRKPNPIAAQTIEKIKELSGFGDDRVYTNEVRAEIHEAVSDRLDAIDDPELLSDVYYESLKRCKDWWKIAPDTDSLDSAEADTYCDIEEAVLFRLGEIKTDESAKVIVGLLADPELSFDTSRGLCMFESLRLFGGMIIPLLKNKSWDESDQYLVEQVIYWIAEDKKNLR